MSSKIQIKRATQAILQESNPILADGEMAYETDTGRLRIGDGQSAYLNLPSFPNITSSNVTDFVVAASGASSVKSVSNKTGDVTLSSTDISDFTVAASGASAVQSVAGKTGAVILTSSDITNFNTSVASGVFQSIYNPLFVKTNSISSQSWLGVAYGNGIFIAIPSSSSAGVFTSSDGVSWTQRTISGQSITTRKMVFGNGLFVIATLTATTAYTSPDGINWTTRTLPGAGQNTGITYGNGTFVITKTSSTQIITSNDGITWTQRSSPVSISARSAMFGNNLFMIFQSSSSTYVTSYDGITWTQRTLPVSTGSLGLLGKNCAYGNGIFVLIANSGSNFLTSIDGINWTTRTFPTSNSVNDIVYTNGLFIALCQNGDLVFSSNGIDWTINTTNNLVNLNWDSNINNFYTLVYGNNKLVVTPDTGSNTSLAIANFSISSITSGDDLVNNIRKLSYDNAINHGSSGSSRTLNDFASLQFCSLSASCTFTMPSATIPRSITLVLTQTGSFTATFTGVKWSAGAAPTITTGANKVDVIRFISDGTSWYGVINQNY